MEVERNQPPQLLQDRLKLYCVGSAELSQFYIPYNEEKRRRNTSRLPVCLSDMKSFLLIDENTEQRKETIIPNPLLQERIVGVACGGTHTIINTASGRVFSWGSNDEGALGRDGEESIPLQVQLEAPIDMISAGDAHSIFVSRDNGMLYFTGAYKGIVRGFLGDVIRKPQLLTVDELSIKPKKHSEPFRKVVSGNNHTLILVGQTAYIRGDIEYFASGRRILERHKEKYDSLKFQAMGIKHVADVFTCGMHCFVKTSDKRYFAWGNNAYGQLGIGNREHQSNALEVECFSQMNLVNIVGGEHHSIFLTADGEVYACGKNDNGQLGLGQDIEEDHTPPLSRSRITKRSKKPVPQKEEVGRAEEEPISKQTPAKQSEEHSLGERLNINFIWQPRKLELSNIAIIGSGTHFSYAVGNQKTQNQLYSWGMGQNYVLISGTQMEKYTPFEVPPKIINHEIVRQINGGGQHVAYLATNNPNLEMKLEESAFANHIMVKKGKIISKLH